MKTIRLLTLAVLTIISTAIFAQEKQSTPVFKNHITATIGGTGIGLSINYSRSFLVKTKSFMDASIGIGSVPFSGGTSIPHQVSFNFGNNGNYLELGFGGNYWSGTSNATAEQEALNSYNVFPIIGYRKQFKNHLLFKVYANPFIHISGEHIYENMDIMPYLGLSFGYSF